MVFDVVMSSICIPSSAFLCTLMARKVCSPVSDFRNPLLDAKETRAILANHLKGKEVCPSPGYDKLTRKNQHFSHQWRWHLFIPRNDKQNASEPTSDAVCGVRPVAAIRQKDGCDSHGMTIWGRFLTKTKAKKARNQAPMPDFSFAPLRFFTCISPFAHVDRGTLS